MPDVGVLRAHLLIAHQELHALKQQPERALSQVCVKADAYRLQDHRGALDFVDVQRPMGQQRRLAAPGIGDQQQVRMIGVGQPAVVRRQLALAPCKRRRSPLCADVEGQKVL